MIDDVQTLIEHAPWRQLFERTVLATRTFPKLASGDQLLFRAVCVRSRWQTLF